MDNNESMVTENDVSVSELIGTIDSFLSDLNATIGTLKQRTEEPTNVLTSNDFVGKSKVEFAFHDINNQDNLGDQGLSDSERASSCHHLASKTDQTKSQERLVVKHEYFDYTEPSAAPIADLNVLHRATSCISFPQTLHIILENAHDGGYDDIISWQCHGRAFRVHNQSKFIAQIMPNFFQQTRFASFQRQLALYGFIRLTRKGKDFGAYYHAKFLRGYPHLTYTIQRTPVKGTFVQKIPSPDTEPDFYSMKPAGLNKVSTKKQSVFYKPESQFTNLSMTLGTHLTTPTSMAVMPSINVTAAMYMLTQQNALREYFSTVLSTIVENGTALNGIKNPNTLPISFPKSSQQEEIKLSAGLQVYNTPIFTASAQFQQQQPLEPRYLNQIAPNEFRDQANVPYLTNFSLQPAISTIPSNAPSTPPNPDVFSHGLLNTTGSIIQEIQTNNEVDNISLSDYATDGDWDEGFKFDEDA